MGAGAALGPEVITAIDCPNCGRIALDPLAEQKHLFCQRRELRRGGPKSGAFFMPAALSTRSDHTEILECCPARSQDGAPSLT